MCNNHHSFTWISKVYLPEALLLWWEAASSWRRTCLASGFSVLLLSSWAALLASNHASRDISLSVWMGNTLPTCKYHLSLLPSLLGSLSLSLSASSQACFPLFSCFRSGTLTPTLPISLSASSQPCFPQFSCFRSGLVPSLITSGQPCFPQFSCFRPSLPSLQLFQAWSGTFTRNVWPALLPSPSGLIPLLLRYLYLSFCI